MNENKTNINCEKTIYINIDSNYWKNWIIDIEIFTYFNKVKKGDINYGKIRTYNNWK